MSALLLHFFTRIPDATRTFSWRYVTARRAVTVGGYEYSPVSAEPPSWNRTISEAEATLKVANEIAPIPMYLSGNPPTNLWLEVHRAEAPTVLEFAGKVMAVDFEMDSGMATVKLAAATGTLSGEVPTKRYLRACSWRLFDSFCGVNAADYRVTVPRAEATVGVETPTLQHATFATFADGWFTRGWVQCGYERAWITSHEGDTLILLTPFVSPTGSLWEVYPGCGKNRVDCAAKFNNLTRFGGCSTIPIRNPHISGV